MTKQLALIGASVLQSPSPAMHKAALAALGLDWDYRAVAVGRGQLPSRWAQLSRGFQGLNVTTPHKEQAFRLVDEVTAEAAMARSVNTVVFAGGRSLGATTDGRGFLAALALGARAKPSRAVILGSGGAARSVALALLQTGCEVVILARRPAAAREIAADLAEAGLGPVPSAELDAGAVSRELSSSDLLVNATTLGSGQMRDRCPLPLEVSLPAALTVFDLVYSQTPTPLLRWAERCGCRAMSGLEMLVQQAALSFQLWTGIQPPVELMRSAAQGALGRLGSPL
jgi:shikimate dehydrogenase